MQKLYNKYMYIYMYILYEFAHIFDYQLDELVNNL